MNPKFFQFILILIVLILLIIYGLKKSRDHFKSNIKYNLPVTAYIVRMELNVGGTRITNKITEEYILDMFDIINRDVFNPKGIHFQVTVEEYDYIDRENGMFLKTKQNMNINIRKNGGRANDLSLVERHKKNSINIYFEAYRGVGMGAYAGYSGQGKCKINKFPEFRNGQVTDVPMIFVGTWAMSNNSMFPVDTTTKSLDLIVNGKRNPSLTTLVVHEIGHILGLDHPNQVNQGSYIDGDGMRKNKHMKGGKGSLYGIPNVMLSGGSGAGGSVDFEDWQWEIMLRVSIVLQNWWTENRPDMNCTCFHKIVGSIITDKYNTSKCEYSSSRTGMSCLYPDKISLRTSNSPLGNHETNKYINLLLQNLSLETQQNTFGRIVWNKGYKYEPKLLINKELYNNWVENINDLQYTKHLSLRLKVGEHGKVVLDINTNNIYCDGMYYVYDLFHEKIKNTIITNMNKFLRKINIFTSSKRDLDVVLSNHNFYILGYKKNRDTQKKNVNLNKNKFPLFIHRNDYVN
jgi:hypothetical protein